MTTVYLDCKQCKHYKDSAIFELCLHEKSKYKVDGDPREHYHTISHMRLHTCGALAVLRTIY